MELANSARLKQALALHQQGQLLQAQALYQEILQSQPRHFDALQLLGAIAAQQQDSEGAVILFEQALAINAQQAYVFNNLGIALGDLKRHAQALECYDKALMLDPGYVEAHSNRGNTLLKLKRAAEALCCYEQALLLNPAHADVHNNRGNALREMQQPVAALESFEQALRINPNDAQAHNNRGLVLSDLHHYAAALESFSAALKIKPDHVDANFNQSLCRLLTADFVQGWQQHEWRWKTESGIRDTRVFAQALWLGQFDLKDQTILLHAEQGFGDMIQFCRYAKQVAALGACVLLEVPTPLAPLLRDLDGVSRLVCREETLPDFDFHCPLMSLPLALQTHAENEGKQGKGAIQGVIQGVIQGAIFTNAAYLHSTPAKRAQWQHRLKPGNKKKVGLAWSGNPEHGNDAYRSIRLEQFLLIANNHDIDCYCMQKDVREADQAMLAQTSAIHCFGAGPDNSIHDFSDTAALLDLMDLVITVDTSVAHLAGAMGKPVWILLPFNSDWRWQIERTDSPWYGSARLFRQSAMDDWDSVLAQVITALQAPI